VAQAALSAFNREQQSNDTAAFVGSAPDVARGSARHHEMVAAGALLVAGFVVPWLVASLWRARISLTTAQPESVEAAAAQIRDWQTLWWWKPAVIDARRLAVAALGTLLPWRSEWVAVALFAVLLALQAATIATQPYAEARDNRLESAPLLTATRRVAANLEGAHGTGALVACVSIASLLARAAVCAGVAREAALRAQEWAQGKAAHSAAREWRELVSEGLLESEEPESK
jgi:hypothetical protein